MEDEFTRRIDAQVDFFQKLANQHFKDKDIAEYHKCTGRIVGLLYSKEMYLLLKEMNKI